MNHKKIEARNQELSDIFSSYEKNTIHPSCDAFKDSKKRNRHRRDQLYLHDGNIKKDRYGKDFKNCHASSIPEN